MQYKCIGYTMVIHDTMNALSYLNYHKTRDCGRECFAQGFFAGYRSETRRRGSAAGANGRIRAVPSLKGRTRPDRKVKKMRVGSVRFGFCGAVRFKEE